MVHKVYVYGTLRKGGPTCKVRGRLYDVANGRFPGIILNQNGWVTCEILEVDDDLLKKFDKYEGYNPDDLGNSLYIRRPIEDGFIYEFNRDVDEDTRIESGDWYDKN